MHDHLITEVICCQTMLIFKSMASGYHRNLIFMDFGTTECKNNIKETIHGLLRVPEHKAHSQCSGHVSFGVLAPASTRRVYPMKILRSHRIFHYLQKIMRELLLYSLHNQSRHTFYDIFFRETYEYRLTKFKKTVGNAAENVRKLRSTQYSILNETVLPISTNIKVTISFLRYAKS